MGNKQKVVETTFMVDVHENKDRILTIDMSKMTVNIGNDPFILKVLPPHKSLDVKTVERFGIACMDMISQVLKIFIKIIKKCSDHFIDYLNWVIPLLKNGEIYHCVLMSSYMLRLLKVMELSKKEYKRLVKIHKRQLGKQ